MLKLYSYWRSSSSYRVRIALNLKLLSYETVPINLLRDGGEQRKPEYLALNPQGLIPLLVDGDFRLGQSLAIFHYLEARAPQPPLLPADPCEAARMWSFCLSIASEIQSMQNTRVMRYLEHDLAIESERREAWPRHWIGHGLDALERELSQRPATPYCFGDTPTYADCCLVPQMFAAERFGAMRDWPRLRAVTEHCKLHPAFVAAHPENQGDAPKA